MRFLECEIKSDSVSDHQPQSPGSQFEPQVQTAVSRLGQRGRDRLKPAGNRRQGYRNAARARADRARHVDHAMMKARRHGAARRITTLAIIRRREFFLQCSWRFFRRFVPAHKITIFERGQ